VPCAYGIVTGHTARCLQAIPNYEFWSAVRPLITLRFGHGKFMKHWAQQYPFAHKTLSHNDNIVLGCSDRIARDSGVDETWEKDEATNNGVRLQRTTKHIKKYVRLPTLNYP
jgi:hypothetical protein